MLGDATPAGTTGRPSPPETAMTRPAVFAWGLLGFAALAVGCKSKDSDSDGGGSGGGSGGSGGGAGGSSKTSDCKLAGHWAGQFNVTVQGQGGSLRIPAELEFTKTGQVAMTIYNPVTGEPFTMSIEHEGQLIMSNPFTANGGGTHASVQVTKFSATADKVVVRTRNRSADVPADHRDRPTNDTTGDAEMTFTLKGDRVEARATETKVVDGRRTQSTMTGTFTRVAGPDDMDRPADTAREEGPAPRRKAGP